MTELGNIRNTYLDNEPLHIRYTNGYPSIYLPMSIRPLEVDIQQLQNLNIRRVHIDTTQLPNLYQNVNDHININDTTIINIDIIDYIVTSIQRLFWVNHHNTTNNIVYNDGQNVHNNNVQNSFRNSLSNLLKDKPTLTLDIVKQQILDCKILTEQNKREIQKCCEDKTEHTTCLITYADLLVYVWSRIINHEHKNEMLKILNQEINDSINKCFTGRLTRLINVLVGFYDDIEIQISDNEQITNVILNLKTKFAGDQLKDEVRKELLDRKYSETVINEWLTYIT